MKSKNDYPRFLGAESDLGLVPQVAILSAPLAATVSWGGGTQQGPLAILQASPALEVFDDELLQETVRAGIVTRPPLPLADCRPEDACRLIKEAVARELEAGLFPVLLGGEHTVSGPAAAAMRERYPDLHVVQVDAHLDLRDSYDGNKLSHACVMRRIDDLEIPFSQVGIRSFSAEEWQLVRERRLRPFTMARIREQADWLAQLLAEIKGPVYLTIDLDGLDPAIIPATGTPEPGGLSWWELIALIRALARGPQGLVGLDVVELAPRPGLEYAAFTAAKVIYRTLGYLFPQSESVASATGPADPASTAEHSADPFYDCRRCGYCCQGETTVSLDAADLARMSAHLGLHADELIARFLRRSGKVIQMQTVDGHCIFYDNGCTIHEGKPWRCRQWPLHPSMLADASNFETIRDSCPGFKTGLTHEEFRAAMKRG